MRVPTFCRENDHLLQDLLLTFQRYAELSGSVTMRAFSSQCFHDTKYFERNVRELFLGIARKYNIQLAAACTEAELGERDQLSFWESMPVQNSTSFRAIARFCCKRVNFDSAQQNLMA